MSETQQPSTNSKKEIPLLPDSPFIALIMTILGWIMVITGGFVAMIGMVSLLSFTYTAPASFSAGLSSLVMGFFLIAAASALKWLNQIRWAVLSEEQKKRALWLER